MQNNKNCKLLISLEYRSSISEKWKRSNRARSKMGGPKASSSNFSYPQNSDRPLWNSLDFTHFIHNTIKNMCVRLLEFFQVLWYMPSVFVNSSLYLSQKLNKFCHQDFSDHLTYYSVFIKIDIFRLQIFAIDPPFIIFIDIT